MKIQLSLQFVLLVFGTLIASTNGAVIFDTIIPDNSSCLTPGDFGCLCDHSLDCNSTRHLECIDYKCFCKNPMHRIYDNKLQRCVGLVGAKCSLEIGGPHCIRNAECDANNRCDCLEGYSSTSKKMCMIHIGEQCGPFQCNNERGFACKSGICQCLDSSYTYSAITRHCFDPETFVSTFLEWFGRGFIRETIVHKAYHFVKRFINIFTFPSIFKVG